MTTDAHLIASHKLPRKFFEINYVYAWTNFLGTLVLIAGLVFLGAQASLPIMILSALFVGILQYRMSIVLHDCVHLSLFKGKRANTITGTIAASLLFTTFRNFQAGHMAHHKYYRTEEDPSLPDYDIKPTSRRELIWFIVQPLVGYGLVVKLLQFWDVQRGKTKVAASARPVKTAGWDIAGFVLVQGALFALTGFNVIAYGILVVIPMATIVLFLSRLRTFLEHGDVEEEEGPPMNCGRNTLSDILERTILSPLNFNYHYWHHKYPALPSAQLPEFHDWYLGNAGTEAQPTEEIVSSSFAETLYHFYGVASNAEKQPRKVAE